MDAVLDLPAPQRACAGKLSLAGLGREGLRAALAGRRRARQAAQDAGRPAVELDVCARRHGVRGDVGRLQGAARHPGAGLLPGTARDRRRAGVGRRHAQVAVAAAHPRPREARPRDRGRLHSRGRSRHAVHLEPGRLHAHLLVLPHRHAATGAQPRGVGDRRPGAAGARPHRRLAGCGAAAGRRPAYRRRSARSPTSC